MNSAQSTFAQSQSTIRLLSSIVGTRSAMRRSVALSEMLANTALNLEKAAAALAL
jgi:hypothetical protein